MERQEKHLEIMRVEKEGRFGNLTKKEHEKKLKVDKLIYRRTNAKDFRAFLNANRRIALVDNNEEIVKLLDYLIENYDRMVQP